MGEGISVGKGAAVEVSERRRRERVKGLKTKFLTTFCKMTKMPFSNLFHPTAEIRSNLEINGPD